MKPSRHSHTAIAFLILSMEAVFVFFLYAALTEKILVITPAAATAGVPELISYQGMLTDASGNPLGGTGAVYCFRYSIYDALTGGNQLWPAGTPSNSTTTVTDGVFSDQLGRMDSLSALDFESTSTYYLQVQVSTSSPTCASGLETLSPREQITSDAWSETSQAVYGSQLKTTSSTNKVQIGTGGGGASFGNQTLLTLDWVTVSGGETIGSTTCSGENGSLWYDSTLNRTLVCENGVVQPVSLHSGSAFYIPYWNASGTLLSATSSIFISSSTGNVGIGTTTPATTLDVNGNITDRALTSQNCVGTNATGTLIAGTCTGGSSGVTSINNGSGTYSITAGTNITISTTSNSTVINSTGGSGNPSVAPAGTLQVASSTSGQFAAYGGSTACGAGNAVTTISAAGGTTCVTFVGSVVSANGISGSVSGAGVLTITLGAITPSSIVDSGALSAQSSTFTGHVIASGTVPTGSCTLGNITVTGHDTAGSFVNGSSTTGCTLTFNQPFVTNAPICTVTIASGTFQPIKASSTVSTLQILASTTFATSSRISWICIGI